MNFEKILMRKIVGSCMLAFIVVLASCSHKTDGANVKEKLAAAKEAGNSVLMVVTKTGVSADSLMAIVQDAGKEIKNNVVLLMDVDDSSNADLVEEYLLTNARIPLVLLFSNRGIMLGGMTKGQASKEAILETLPTPKFSEIIYAVSQGKSTFTIVSQKGFADREATLTACINAQKELPTLVDIVEVDMADKAEANLVVLLNINADISETITVVLNPMGEITGQFNGVPEQSELVEAAKAVVPHGCSQDHSGEENCSHNHD